MPQYPIPTDWNGTDWACIIIEWPQSVEWFGILRGLVTTPLRGRFWDGKTGSIIDAQDIGLEIEERNPVTTCEDIVLALQGIQVAVESLDVSADTQLTIQTNIQNNISVVATAIADSLATQTTDLVLSQNASSVASATAFAWAEAIARNTTSITIINNFQNEFRPIDVATDPPPQAQEATPTGITASLESTAPTEICKRVYWLIRDLKEYLNYLDSVNEFSAKTVLALSGLLADGLWVAGLRVDAAGARFLIPAAIFMSAAHNLQQALFDGLNPFGDLLAWIESKFETLVCDVALAVEDEATTEELRQIFITSMNADLVNPLFQFLPLLVTNFSSLAALYYVAPDLPAAPAVPASEPADICSSCAE